MKLTEVQRHLISEAYSKSLFVLNEIKHSKLSPRDVEHMKILEDAVSNIETFRIVAFSK
jgi:hypothetical protein